MTEDQINAIKSRIGEALVEALLREAGYEVCRTGKESHFQGVTKTGRAPAPDFVVFRPSNSGLFCLFHLEVKYRANIEFFLKDEAEKGAQSLFEEQSKWPALSLIMVTDLPRRGRSCFQVVNLSQYQTGQPLQTKDLADWELLDTPRDVISSYQAAAQDLFSALTYQAQLTRQLRELRGAEPHRLRVGVA